MATDVLPDELDEFRTPAFPRRETELGAAIASVLRPLASLKLTVTLFALAIILIFAGTLAQARHDIWWVLNNYFRTPVAWIELNVFFPPAWFADYPNLVNVQGSFPFPGGFAIGTAMAVNLLAAHGLRFKVQTKGKRLWAGLAVIAAGCVITWLVVAAGPDKDGSQATSPVEWTTLWRMFLVGIACVCGGIAAALFSIDPARKVERVVLGCVGTALLILLGYLMFGVDSQAIDPSAMRILWQLMKAEFAALVLLAGCVLAFRKRAGIVLLHAGVGLIMANELVVHFLHKEEQMMIIEGHSANYAYDIRATELAIIDPSNPQRDEVTVVPGKSLEESAKDGTTISNPKLPFEVRVTKYFENSDLLDGKPSGENSADSGTGRLQYAVASRPATGSDADRVNIPAAYAEFIDKASGKSLGKYLLGIMVSPQRVKVDGKTYEVALRFERDYKPYTIQLNEVRGDMYMGTSIPRNYSSEIRLEDVDRGVDRRAYIRMNEPLRYGGETFYQSGFDDGERTGVRSTTLQVVANFGWMIPYVACMVIITGMLAQFMLTLRRFLSRLEPKKTEGGNLLGIASVVAVFACIVIWFALPPSRQISTFDFDAAGKIPVLYGGRVQPLDSLARSTLRTISSREVFVDKDGATRPAMKWLMDVIARPEVAAEQQVIRIDSPEVRDMLQLPRHISHSLFGGSVQRYSPNELAPHADELHAEVERIRKKSESESKQYTTIEKKVIELAERGEIYQSVADGFHLAPELNTQAGQPAPLLYLSLIERQIPDDIKVGPLPTFPTKAEIEQDPQESLKVIQLWLGIDERMPYDRFLRKYARPPLVVPSRESRLSSTKPADEHSPTQWVPYSAAWLEAMGDLLTRNEPNPAWTSWNDIIKAYGEQNVGAFNAAVANYRTALENDPPRQVLKASPGFEAWFNHADLFFVAMIFYLLAFVLVAFSWLSGWTTLNRAAFWLIAAVFVVHTFALVARMTISGRPPVTNLYSTAIFIGWAGVLLGLILELVFYRLGFGAAIAAIAGCATLLVADKLSLLVDSESRGDTIGVMRAVLDTQFWLATHVTTVNLGYATTYIAGLLGIVYVVAGVLTPALTKDMCKLLGRMIYGAVCFAMVFSFFGTVLGGLWADDSWGRFWGWDPKENGALIIVIWNALILHARWDGLVKDRGLAILAIAGNIFTSWSYFGVNQLGVGLHSYGFTEGVLKWLGIIVLSQIVLIAAGMLPQRFWMSRRNALA